MKTTVEKYVQKMWKNTAKNIKNRHKNIFKQEL